MIRSTEIRKVFAPLVQSFRQAETQRRSTKLVAATLGYTRQYYYKQCSDIAKEESKKVQVKYLVDQQRKLLPRVGTRKLYYLIKSQLEAQGIKFGRDKLFALLSECGLLIKPPRRYTQTTMSKHWMRKWPNLVKGVAIEEPDQVWVRHNLYQDRRRKLLFKHDNGRIQQKGCRLRNRPDNGNREYDKRIKNGNFHKSEQAD